MGLTPESPNWAGPLILAGVGCSGVQKRSEIRACSMGVAVFIPLRGHMATPYVICEHPSSFMWPHSLLSACVLSAQSENLGGCNIC